MQELKVGDVAWRLPDVSSLGGVGWDGAWVLILSKEDMWTIASPAPGQHEFCAYDVLCPDGSIKKYTSAVLRKEKK